MFDKSVLKVIISLELRRNIEKSMKILYSSTMVLIHKYIRETLKNHFNLSRPEKS